MKNIILSVVLALGLSSVSLLANEPTAAPAAPAAGEAKKMTKKEAKEACKELKGKEHHKCVKEKMGK